MRSRNPLTITDEAIIGLAKALHPKSYTLTIHRGVIVGDGFSTLVLHCTHMRGWRVARVGRGGAGGWSEITDMNMVRGLILELENAYSSSTWWTQRAAQAQVHALRDMSADALLLTVFGHLRLSEE